MMAMTVKKKVSCIERAFLKKFQFSLVFFRITSVATHLEKAFFFLFFLFLFLLLKEKLRHDFYMLKPFT